MSGPPAQGSYDLTGFLRVSVEGSDHPVGRVMDQTLQAFRAMPSEPDLRIILGEYPSANCNLILFTVGDRLIYFFYSDATTVFRAATAAEVSREGVEYIIIGDLRKDSSKITVYVPSLPNIDGYLKSIRRGISRRSFARTLLALARSRSFLRGPIELEAARIRLAILEPLLYYRLPYRGSTLVHGSVVSSDGSGLMFTGGGHIGKTALSLEMVRRGFSYLGDDLSILGVDGLAYPYPEPIRIQEQHLSLFPDLEATLSSRMGRGERFLFRRLVGTSPQILELLPRLPVTDVVRGAALGGRCKLENVLLIRKGSKGEPSLQETDLESTVGAMAAELFWEFEAGHWRNNQYIYCPSCAKGKDFLSEEEDHRRAVTRVMSDGLRGARTFKLLVPYGFRITDAMPFVDRVLGK